MPQITCAHCSQPYLIPPEQWPEYQDRQINCTRCGQPFDVIDPAAPPCTVGPKKEMTRRTAARLVGGIILFDLLLCGIALALIVVDRTFERVRREQSAATLHEIGLAALTYANADKEGRFPVDFKTMLKTQDITISFFVSPRRNTIAPKLTDPDKIGDWANNYSDYVWVGAGIRNVAGADTVLAYEKPEGLPDGVEVLFADGHVEFEPMSRARVMIAILKQGKNPP